MSGCQMRWPGAAAAPVAYRMLMVMLALLVCALSPQAAYAENAETTVRVGWFDSPFNKTDELDRRSGYAYEYQQEIAAYTGWTYEYVQGSWPDLLQMLIEGKIDLLADVSRTDERAGLMSFSTLPMGTEKYYAFAAPHSESISSDDYATFEGKTVGVNKGSLQLELFRSWAADNGIHANIVELTGSEQENATKLRRGAIDLYVATDSIGEQQGLVPVCKIGSSDFYFAISNDRPELVAALNSAMARIQEENASYNQQLAEKYLQTTSIELFLNSEEHAWLDDHEVVRVGYQDNYLAFCATDPATGQLTGALKDYLEAASDCLADAHVEFEPIGYPTAADALDALRAGEVDCVFPANLTDYDGESQGLFITSPVMRTDMSAVIRETDQKSFSRRDRVVVAVNVGNTNYEMFLLDHFPEWRAIYFADTPECLRAIRDGKADCLLISNYRYNNIAALCKKYKLVTLSTGVAMDYCFAVDRSDTTLYSILNKMAAKVPSSTINASLTHYFTEDAKTSLSATLRQHTSLAVAVFAFASLAIIATILANTRRRHRKI